MRTQDHKLVLITICTIFLFPLNALSQSDSLVIWRGCISGPDSHGEIPHATIASYKQVARYISDEKGCFVLRLPYNDSIRIAALGFEARTIVLNQQRPDSTNRLQIELKQQSFDIKEVTVKGYQGIFDPLIFPRHLDDAKKINLHLPAHIGSQVSDIPPHERADAGSMGILGALVSPASFIRSQFSRSEKSKLRLPEAREEARVWNHKEAVAGRQVIALISGYNGEALDRFVIYCNLHLKISASDNGVSATRKIEALLSRYQSEEQNKSVPKPLIR
jgi:hypothetical protein